MSNDISLANQETNGSAADTLTADTAAGFINLSENDEVIEAGDGFDLNGFQVVRREFFAHLREPSATFSNCKFYVNQACINKFPKYDYAQVLINREEKILALRPCSEWSKDAYQWCGESKGKRKPKQVTCKLFFAKVFEMLEWNPSHRYKLLGRLIHSNDEYLVVFDLEATEVYQRTSKEGEKPKNSRTPVFPAAWKDQFGLPFNDHQQAMQVNIVDNYAIYSIKEAPKAAQKSAESSLETAEPVQSPIGDNAAETSSEHPPEQQTPYNPTTTEQLDIGGEHYD